MKLVSFVLWIVFSYTCLQAQTRIFVAANATGQNTGSTWQDAFTDLHDALNLANPGDSIWVAAGTYFPDLGMNRTRSFFLKSGVGLFGGFNGSEQSFQERNVQLYRPILSGNIGNLSDSTDNSYTVLTMTLPDSNTVLDGVIIQDGVANGTSHVNSNTPDICGGGVFVWGGGTNEIIAPKFLNSIFRRNFAKADGGAIFISRDTIGANPVLRNCFFEQNTALRDGGGFMVAYRHTDTIEMNDCSFKENRVGYRGSAGFIHFKNNKTFKLNRDTFSNNEGGTGSCILLFPSSLDTLNIEINACEFKYNESGGVVITSLQTDYDCSIRISKCTYLHNKGFGVNVVTDGKVSNYSLEDCLIDENNGGFAPPFIFGDTVIVRGNIFKAKGFSYYGIDLRYGNHIIFDKNKVAINSPFVAVRGLVRENIFSELTDTSFQDGALFTIGDFQNNLFVNNKCNANYTTPIFSPLDCSFTNNIFLNNRNNAGQIVIPVKAQSGPAQPNYFRNNATELACSNLPAYLSCNYGNFTITPGQFTLPDYRPIACSDLINRGLNVPNLSQTDFSGQPRIIDGIVDVGIFETQTFWRDTTVTTEASCANQPTGALQIELPYACGNLQYQWVNSLGQAGTGSTQLASGVYQVTVTDSKGRTGSFAAFVAQNPALQVETVLDSVICGGIVGGTAGVRVQGVTPFNFTWIDAPQIPDSIRTQLAIGFYQLITTDANGCSETSDFQVGAKGSLSLLVDAQAIDCFGDNSGSVSAVPISGLMPYNWKWNTGSIQNPLTNLVSAQYEVTVTDALGCTSSFVFNLPEPDSFLIVSQMLEASNSPGLDGAITIVSVSGGTAPYYFDWENGDTTSYRNGLAPGVYTVTITDGNNCQKVLVFEVDMINGMEQPQAAVAWQLLPNLVHGAVESVQVVGIEHKAWKSQIINIHGQIVLEQALKADMALPVSSLPAGMYFVKMSSIENKNLPVRVFVKTD